MELLLLMSMLEYSFLEASRSPSPPIFTNVQHYPCICYLPPDSGLCATFGKLQDAAEDNFDKKDKLLTRYYFDAVTEQCYPFGAQECGGNQNRFLNLTECQNVCRIRKPSLSQRTNSTPTLPPEYT